MLLQKRDNNRRELRPLALVDCDAIGPVHILHHLLRVGELPPVNQPHSELCFAVLGRADCRDHTHVAV